MDKRILWLDKHGQLMDDDDKFQDYETSKHKDFE